MERPASNLEILVAIILIIILLIILAIHVYANSRPESTITVEEERQEFVKGFRHPGLHPAVDF
jgi:hypothetical protein